MSLSLISNVKECYICHTTYGLHKHHIYPGAMRNKSEQYGCWVWLCGAHHNLSNKGIHFDRNLDRQMRRLCQERFTEAYPDEDFMQIFKHNYL